MSNINSVLHIQQTTFLIFLTCADCSISNDPFIPSNIIEHYLRLPTTANTFSMFVVVFWRFKCHLYINRTSFSNISQLSHENTHKTGDGSSSSLKQFPCESCDKSYSSLKALKDHKKNVHAEIKQVHSCKVCFFKVNPKFLKLK